MSAGIEQVENQNPTPEHSPEGKLQAEAVSLLSSSPPTPGQDEGPRVKLDALDIQISLQGKVTPAIRDSYNKIFETNEGTQQTDSQKELAQAGRLRLAQNLAATGDFAGATKELVDALKRYPELVDQKQFLETAKLSQSIHNRQFSGWFKDCEGDQKELGAPQHQLLSNDEKEKVKIETDRLDKMDPDQRREGFSNLITTSESKQPQSHVSRYLSAIGRVGLLDDLANRGANQQALDQLRVLAKQYPETMSWKNVLSAAGSVGALKDKEFMNAFKETDGSEARLRSFSNPRR
jgi:hypothetical protein